MYNLELVKEAAETIRSFNHPIRLQIVDLLEKNNRLTVTDIYVKLRVEQSVASQHLAILRKAGVLDTERNGKYIHYFLNKSRIDHITKNLESLAA